MAITSIAALTFVSGAIVALIMHERSGGLLDLAQDTEPPDRI
jgi:hypothetical protein